MMFSGSLVMVTLRRNPGHVTDPGEERCPLGVQYGRVKVNIYWPQKGVSLPDGSTELMRIHECSLVS